MTGKLIAAWTKVGLTAAVLTAVMSGYWNVHAQSAQNATGNSWFADAQLQLQSRLKLQPNTSKAKNVILFIGDGNGIGTNFATRVFEGQSKGGYGEENSLSYETFPYLALAKTYNTNAQTPDSAGTATAINSGVKTKSGVIGVDETLRRGDCTDVKSASVRNFADVVSAMGKSVGVVSTARLTHATPAAVYAHVADRKFEDDSALPEDCDIPDIALQLMAKMEDGVVNIALGGGRRHFKPRRFGIHDRASGRRADGRNLVLEAMSEGARFAWDSRSLAALQLDHSAPVLGLFDQNHMDFSHDRQSGSSSLQPSLVEMTQAAITNLSHNKAGYFLTVEAGRIDHANHGGNLYRAMSEGVEFANAVSKAVEMVSAQDTLIIVTADHGHAIAFNGYCGRGSPINGLCYSVDPEGEKHLEETEEAADGLPYTSAGYLNGKGSVLKRNPDGGYSGSRALVAPEEALDPDYIQQAMLPRSTDTHSPVDVAVYAIGPWGHLIDGTIEQNFLFHVMVHAVTGE